jgi:hypothetical protein
VAAVAAHPCMLALLARCVHAGGLKISCVCSCAPHRQPLLLLQVLMQCKSMQHCSLVAACEWLHQQEPALECAWCDQHLPHA